MTSRRLFVVCVGVVALAAASTAQTGWTVPRLADGRPDLQGVWENNSATPLERPREFANKPRLSASELAELQQRAGVVFGPESDAVFGDALVPGAARPEPPAAAGRHRDLQLELAAGSILRAAHVAD